MHYSDIDELVLLHKLCIRSKTPFAIGVAKLIQLGNYQDLMKIEIDPADYDDAATFAQDYNISKYLSKWEGFKKLVVGDTRTAAINTWISVEYQNQQTEKRLSLAIRTPYDEIFHLARVFIAKVLGSLDVDSVLDRGRWTSGATHSAKHGTALDLKISGYRDVTSRALPYISKIIEEDPVWYEAITGQVPEGSLRLLKNNFEVIECNRFVTVPKTAKTDRAICAEPTLNMFLQQSVMQYMTHRMERHGIRLDDQSINQAWASKAQKLGLATVDLQNASDSLTTQLVYNLLPNEWAMFLDDLRCKYTRVGKRKIHLSKFCSMGNAFTFPLETLIFHSLSRACDLTLGLHSVVSTFGDDIIIDKRAYSLLVSVLNYVGFEVNSSKSYVEGRFFESCGAHYYDGILVTPMYQKHMISDGLHERIRSHNRIVRWSSRVGESLEIPSTIGLLNYLMKGIKDVPKVPMGVSDDGFIVPTSRVGVYDRSHGFLCRVYVYTPNIRRRVNETALFAYKLRRPEYSNVLPNGRASVTKVGGTWKYRYRYFGVHDIATRYHGGLEC